MTAEAHYFLASPLLSPPLLSSLVFSFLSNGLLVWRRDHMPVELRGGLTAGSQAERAVVEEYN